MIDLSGKIALVTGAGLGIGRGCALELARAGADLVINDRPGSPNIEDAAEEIRALGRQCTTIESDVFSREGCENLTQRALEAVGRIDILVSNPAFGKRTGFLDFDPEDFDRVIDATYKAGFHMSQLVARHMVERGGGGKIIFISSVQAEMPFARNLPYGAAKAAVNHMAQTISVELIGNRINVNAIEPGWIDTPNERATFGDAIDDEGSRLPWGRMGLPADIGHAAAFLASDAADYITGAVIPVDGGFRFGHLRADELIKELDAK